MKDILKKNIKILSVVTFFLIFCNILSALHPFIMKKILDIDLKSENIKSILMNLFFIYTIVHIILLISKNVRNTIINKAMSKILKELREKLFYHVLKWDMATYEKYNSSEIYTRLTADMDNVFPLFFSMLQIFLNDVIYIIMMVIFMFFADVRIAVIGSIAILLNVIFSYVFANQTAKAHKMILNKRDKANRQYSEMYNKNKLTYLFELQETNQEAIFKTLEEELIYRKKFILSEGYIYPLAITIQALAIYIILIYVFNINMAISLGSIYLVINYIQNCRVPLNEIFTRIRRYSIITYIIKEN